REARVGGGERVRGFLEPTLPEERAPEDELRVADLVEEVDPAVEQLERVPRLLLGEVDLVRAEVHLRERRDSLRGVRLAADLERDAEGLLQERLRLVGLAEQEVEAAEVVQQPADAPPVGELLVVRLRALRVRAREHPVALALGD